MNTRRHPPYASALALAALCVTPASAYAQTAGAQEMSARVVVILPFTGNATQDLLDDAEAVVRTALQARGARVPDRAAVRAMMGVAAPRDATSIAGFGRTMSATHVLTGVVTPLSGQYNLAMTLVEVSTARQATAQENVGHHEASDDIRPGLERLFDPASLGAAPVDPEEERRRAEEARRRAEDDRRRAEEARRAEADRARAAEAERQRQYERDHPERPFDQGGPFAVGLGLHLGGLLSGTREAPAMRPAGVQLSEPSSLAAMLRLEGAYSVRSVRGLEVVGAVMLMLSPTSAVSFGGGAQFTYPAAGRGRLRGTAGAVLGLFQGASGARITTVWFEPYVRAQLDITEGFAAFAGLSLDLAPGDNGGVTTLTVNAGLRMRFGS